MRTNFTTVESAWLSYLDVLTNHSTILDSRVGPCRELIGATFMVTKPTRAVIRPREMSAIYAAAELLWYLSWSNSGEMICHYAPSYANYLDARGQTQGAYGFRWQDQVKPLIELLRRDPLTRRAVLGTWSLDDIGTETKDQPCTLSLQFIIRSNTLHLIVTMRSNDMWLGTVYDTFCFTRLQCLIAAELGVEVGTYTHQVGSLHLYEKNYPSASRLVSPRWSDLREQLPFDGYTELTVPLFRAIKIASELEEKWRNKTGEPGQVMFDLAQENMLGTELGAMVLLCSAKNYGLDTLKAFLTENNFNIIDPSLLP